MSIAMILERLEEDLPCLLYERAAGEWTTVLAGSDTRIEVDRGRGTVRIDTPVSGAHDGQSDAVLVELAKLNFPNDLLRHCFFAAGRAAGYLSVVDAFAIASVTPTEAVERVLEQIRVSVEVAERILASRTGGVALIGQPA